MLKTTFDSIKDNEEIVVKSLIEGFVAKETSLFEMIRTYLASLADYSDKKWLAICQFQKKFNKS